MTELNWFQIALQWRDSAASRVFPRVLFFGGFGCLVSLLYYFDLPISWQVLGNVVTNVVFNFVLGLLLVFRTNSAYERFWEGRKTWGGLVVSIRNLSRKIWLGIPEKEPEDKLHKIAILRLLVVFAIATKLHLRHEPMNEEIEALVEPSQFLKLKSVSNPPLQVSLWIGDYLQQQYQRQYINSDRLTEANNLLDNMVESLTGSERILKTPIPRSYAIYLKRLLLIYCLALPFQIVGDLKWWTGAIAGLISFILLGVEEIGNEIENPFGYDRNDLPLDELCKTVRQNIDDTIGHNLKLEGSADPSSGGRLISCGDSESKGIEGLWGATLPERSD
jgi:ion channel-forming bestrophin family protein